MGLEILVTNLISLGKSPSIRAIKNTVSFDKMRLRRILRISSSH